MRTLPTMENLTRRLAWALLLTGTLSLGHTLYALWTHPQPPTCLYQGYGRNQDTDPACQTPGDYEGD